MDDTQASQIETEIEQACTRLQELVSARSNDPRPPEPEGAEERHIAETLTKAGYSKRHIENLAIMHGPSLEKARSLLPRISRGNCLLLLIGDRGPGKTQMATWWAAQRLRDGLYAGQYRKARRLLGEVKETWGQRGSEASTENKVLGTFRKCRFLVLDELQAMGDSHWEVETLNDLIDDRYMDGLATVLIANLAETEWKERIHPHIQSRMEETGGLVVCNWASYRALTAEETRGGKNHEDGR